MPLMAQTAAKPFVIPELKTWTAASGSFAMPASVSIRTAKGEDVGRVGGLLAADLREMFGQESRLVADGRRGGDIVLALKADRQLGPEGYELRIGRDQVVASRYLVVSIATGPTMPSVARCSMPGENTCPCRCCATM